MPEQFDSDTDDDIHNQSRHITLDTDNHMKVKMCNQHNRTGRTRRPRERFGHEIPSKFSRDFR